MPIPLVPTRLRKTFFSLISLPLMDARPATLLFFSCDETGAIHSVCGCHTDIKKKHTIPLKTELLHTPDSDTN